MKLYKLLSTFILALIVSTTLASAYIYTRGDYNPYYARPSYNYGYGGSYYGGPSYNNYYSSFNTGGYMPYSRTYGYYYGGDPYWKYEVLNHFARTSPRWR